jgi:hypothetical protein
MAEVWSVYHALGPDKAARVASAVMSAVQPVAAAIRQSSRPRRGRPPTSRTSATRVSRPPLSTSIVSPLLSVIPLLVWPELTV